jgi:hypothetical protein
LARQGRRAGRRRKARLRPSNPAVRSSFVRTVFWTVFGSSSEAVSSAIDVARLEEQLGAHLASPPDSVGLELTFIRWATTPNEFNRFAWKRSVRAELGDVLELDRGVRGSRSSAFHTGQGVHRGLGRPGRHLRRRYEAKFRRIDWIPSCPPPFRSIRKRDCRELEHRP